MFEYDDLGGVTDEKRYLYDGLDLVEIRDAGGATLGQVIHGPGIDNPQFDGLGAETARYFYHTDHLGSVRLLTDAGGAVARTYDYTAYGVRLDDPAAETTLNPFTYTGREYHAPSGLYFYRARFYDPAVGQFLSADPIGLTGGINVYNYTGNHPTSKVDPTGLAYWDFNFSLPVSGRAGATGGVLIDDSGRVYPYSGPAGISGGAGFGVTYSPNDVTVGANLVYSQGTTFGPGLGASAPLSGQGSPALEGGVITPGITIGVVWVGGALSPEDSACVIGALRQFLYPGENFPITLDPPLLGRGPDVLRREFGPGGVFDPWFGPAGMFRNVPPPPWLAPGEASNPVSVP